VVITSYFLRNSALCLRGATYKYFLGASKSSAFNRNILSLATKRYASKSATDMPDLVA